MVYYYNYLSRFQPVYIVQPVPPLGIMSSQSLLPAVGSSWQNTASSDVL